MVKLRICVFTTFSPVPGNALIRKRSLIHLKNSSTRQRCLNNCAVNSGAKAKLLVSTVEGVLVFSSLTTTRHELAGSSLLK